MTPSLWAAAVTGAATLALAALGASYLLWVWRHRNEFPTNHSRSTR